MMDAISRYFNMDFLYNQEDWKGAKEIALNILEYFNQSVFYLAIAFVWLLIISINWDELDFKHQIEELRHSSESSGSDQNNVS